MISATDAWLFQLRNVLSMGVPAKGTIELMSSMVRWNMDLPLVTATKRNVNYRFAAGEAAYIISGRNDTEYLTRVMSTYKNFVNEGPYQDGAYGPPFVDQLSYVIDCFKKDPETRQAVISIWRPRPYASKDIPCTLTLQFLYRENQLNLVVNMRSSDVWRGLIYDIFCFSCMASVVASACGFNRLGMGYLTAGSSHLYDDTTAAAFDMVQDPGECEQGPLFHVMSGSQLYDVLDGVSTFNSNQKAYQFLKEVFNGIKIHE